MMTKVEEVHTGDLCNNWRRWSACKKAATQSGNSVNSLTHTCAEEIGQTARSRGHPDNNTSRKKDTMESTTNIWTNTLYLTHKLAATTH